MREQREVMMKQIGTQAAAGGGGGHEEKMLSHNMRSHTFIYDLFSNLTCFKNFE